MRQRREMEHDVGRLCREQCAQVGEVCDVMVAVDRDDLVADVAQMALHMAPYESLCTGDEGAHPVDPTNRPLGDCAPVARA